MFGLARWNTHSAAKIVDPLIRQIVALFEQVNVMVGANARKRQFALGADAIIVNSFPEDV